MAPAIEQRITTTSEIIDNNILRVTKTLRCVPEAFTLTKTIDSAMILLEPQTSYTDPETGEDIDISDAFITNPLMHTKDIDFAFGFTTFGVAIWTILNAPLQKNITVSIDYNHSAFKKADAEAVAE